MTPLDARPMEERQVSHHTALQLLEKLVEQAVHAQSSIEAPIAGVKYTGVRPVTLGESQCTMFAISVTSQVTGEPKDIIFARSPELAKFVTLLMNLSGDIVGSVLGALRNLEQNAL